MERFSRSVHPPNIWMSTNMGVSVRVHVCVQTLTSISPRRSLQSMYLLQIGISTSICSLCVPESLHGETSTGRCVHRKISVCVCVCACKRNSLNGEEWARTYTIRIRVRTCTPEFAHLLSTPVSVNLSLPFFLFLSAVLSLLFDLRFPTLLSFSLCLSFTLFFCLFALLP